MTENKRLDGWKEIASYLDKSVKTVQRWEKESGFPIYRIEGKQSVYSFSEDIDKWDKSHNDFTQNSSTDITLNTKATTKTFTQQFIIIVLILCILCTVFIGLYQHRVKAGNNLSVQYKRENYLNSLSIIKGDLRSFDIGRTEYFDYSYRKRIYNCKFVDFVDLQGDKCQEIVFASPVLKNGIQLLFYKINWKGEYSEYDTWNIDLEMSYEDEKHSHFLPFFVTCEDLTNDNIPEIILIQNSQPEYHACLRVFNLDKELLFEMAHPGWLTQLIITDSNNNGHKELYVAGTNNFLRDQPYTINDSPVNEYSSPVFFKLERNWSIKGNINLYGNHKTLSPQLGDEDILTYVNLNKDMKNACVAIWEFAVFNSYLKSGNEDVFLLVYAGIGIKNLSNDEKNFKIRTVSRQFFFDNHLNLRKSFYDQNQIIKTINADNFKTDPSYLIPLYWNGTTWQEEVCRVNSSKKK